MDVRVINNELHIGQSFSLSFQRTLRIPDNDNTYPLPPGLGAFPILRVEDFADRVAASWKERGGVFIPMYQREAMWLSFSGSYEHPTAVKVGVGKINAISGKQWTEKLENRRQDYCIVPDQPWLDGINAGHGFIRQFVAMPLGSGVTVEGQLTGKEEFGGLQLCVYEPKAGYLRRFARRKLPRMFASHSVMECCSMDMGLAAGGKMKQEIFPDTYGFDTWDATNHGRVFVHIVNSEMYKAITEKNPPPTPVSAKSYTDAGLPWFDLYNEGRGDVAPSNELGTVKPLSQLGEGETEDDQVVSVPNIILLKKESSVVHDGNW